MCVVFFFNGKYVLDDCARETKKQHLHPIGIGCDKDNDDSPSCYVPLFVCSFGCSICRLFCVCEFFPSFLLFLWFYYTDLFGIKDIVNIVDIFGVRLKICKTFATIWNYTFIELCKVTFVVFLLLFRQYCHTALWLFCLLTFLAVCLDCLSAHDPKDMMIANENWIIYKKIIRFVYWKITYIFSEFHLFSSFFHLSIKNRKKAKNLCPKN